MKTPHTCVRDRHGSWQGVRAEFSEDIHRFLTKSPEVLVRNDWWHRMGAFCTPQMLAVFLYRLSHCLYAKEWRRCAVLLAGANTVLHGVILSPESCIGPALLLPHPTGVTFFGTAGRELTLYSMAVCSTYAPIAGGGVPRLGNRVTVGAHAAIMGPVSIGDDVKIAYSLRVVRDIPSAMMVVSSAMHVKLRTATVIREN